MKCYFCKKEIVNFGHNPAPLGPSNKRCCDKCNDKVIQVRLNNMRRAI